MKSKKKAIALAAVLGVAGIGGTLAYFNQTLEAANEFDTGKYDTELIEDFKPKDGDNWEPGAKVNKDVLVQNTGDYPVVVRVKFDEKWERKGTKELIYEASSADKKLDKNEENTASNKIESVYQQDALDGKYGQDLDDSVVHKELHLGKDWFYNEKDGYYYYNKILEGVKEDGEVKIYDQTTFLLDSVTLDENADLGRYKEKKYYATVEKQPASDSDEWIEFSTDSNANYISTDEMNALVQKESGGEKEITFMKAVTAQVDGFEGYSNADYTLTVTAQTVQATTGAIKAGFGWTVEELIDTLGSSFNNWKNIENEDEVQTSGN